MTTHIQFHRSNIHGVTPDVSYMFVGEPAVNTYDKKLWVKGPSGDLVLFIDGTTGERVAGSNTEIQFKDANGFSASGKLVFDGFGLSADGATFNNDIIINSILVGRGSGDSNTSIAVGTDALKMNATGIQNIAVGYSALQLNTSGILNTAVGFKALKLNTTGNSNIAVGSQALQTSGTGDSNTAVGERALDANTAGSDNTALGQRALFKNTRGVKNTSVGYQSLYSNEHGVVAIVDGKNVYGNYGAYNTAVGYQSAYYGTTANYNTAVGFKSLYNTDGHSNTALGASAGYGIRTGSKNTALGASAGQLTNRISGNNNTFLGHASEPSSITVSNEITLGDPNVDTIRTGNDGFVISTTHGISAEGATFGGDVIFRGGISADAGATFGGDVVFQGNILLPEDGEVGIGGDTEKIVFNGAGAGSSSIDIKAGHIDFGTGSSTLLRSAGDGSTYIKFFNDLYGTNSDGLQLVQSENVMVDVRPTDVNVAGATFHGGGATFGGPVIITNVGDATLTLNADTDNAVSEDDNPHINFTQDAGSNTFQIGMVGNAGAQYSGGSRAEIPYIKSYWGMQVATKGTLALDIDKDARVHLLGGISADAGATFGAPVNMIDNELSRPKLKDYAETVNAIGTITEDFTINIPDGNVQTVTIGGDCEVDFAGFNPTGDARTATLIITNGGAHTITWDDVIKWPGDNAPALTASGVDIVSFMTIDNGATVYGFVGGINFS